MAYNGYGYSNYSQYYNGQQTDQNGNQQAGSSSQAYQNPYSPYYQAAGQYTQQSSERGQPYQSKPGIDSSGFQQNYYSQPQYQQPPGNENQNAYSQSQPYLSTTQPAPSNYGYSTQSSTDQTSRTYADTSALGNLAYASTLGRNSPTSGQSRESSRQQSSLPAYQMQQSQPQYQQPQPSASDSTVHPQRTKTLSSYASPRDAVRQVQTQQPSPRMSTQAQSRPTQSTYSQPTSAASQQNTNSPRLNQKPRSGQTSNSTQSVHSQSTKSTGSSGKASQTKNKSSNAHQISTIMNQSEPPALTKPAAPQTISHNYSSATQGSNVAMAPSAPTNDPQPTTIDPSQIFDQAEYQRRKRAAEEADAAKRASTAKLTESQPVNVPQSSSKQQRPQQLSPQATQAQFAQQDSSKHVRTDSQAREQIQAEMKAMIEKMREYKSKDPSGFSEIWEQFKKVQPPPPPRVASQTPQTGKGSVPPGGTTGEQSALISPDASNPSFPSPIFGTMAHPATGDSASGFPDLGKFPAMRRKTRNDKGVSRASRGGPAESPAATDTPQPATGKQTASAKAIAHSQPAQTSPADAGAESMRRAMQAFHNTPTPTPSSHQSSPPAPSPRSPVWPEEKKPELAEVAKNFLEGLKSNKGKSISTTEIHMMLNQNPSYDQLCAMLSARGFQFSRTPLAELLLSVVPPSKTTSGPDTPRKSRGRPRKDGTAVSPDHSLGQNNPKQAAVGPQKKKSSATGKSSSPQSNVVSHGLPILNGPSNVAPEYKSYYERMRMISGGSPPSSTSPISKQQAARKRNFSEIVDLSQMSDDDEGQAKKQRAGGDHAGKEQALPPNTGSDLILTNADPNQNEPPVPIDPNLEQTSQQNNAPTGDLSSGAQDEQLAQFRHEDEGARTQREKLRNAVLVKPINMIEALQQRPINISTLARDILIAKGEHPTERPLNFHLRDLAMNFKSVTTKADLSTFRWDLVDPGGPPPGTVLPSVEGISDSEEGDEGDAAKDANRIDAAAKDEEPKRLDSILTRGRGRGRPRGRPRVRGLIFGMRYLASDRHSDQLSDKEEAPKPGRGSLVSRGRARARGASRVGGAAPTAPAFSSETPTTFAEAYPASVARTDIPGLAPEQARVSTSAQGASDASVPAADVMDVDSPSETQDEAMAQESPRRNLMVAASADVLQNPPNLIDQIPLNPSSGGMRISSQSLNPIQLGQKRRGRPPKFRVEIGPTASSTPSVSGQTSDTGSLPRKRGRPPGSKNSPFAPKRPGLSLQAIVQASRPTPQDGIEVNVPSPSPAFKASSLSHVEPQPERTQPAWAAVNQYEDEDPDTDQFTPFPCSWSDCRTRLHNLGTLRKHVRKVHLSQPPKSADGTLHCRWGGCTQQNDDMGDLELLEEHLEDRHFSQISSRFGDGPTTHPTGET